MRAIYLIIFLFIFCSQKEVHITNARKFINQFNYDRALMEILNYREIKDSEIQYLLGYCYLKKNEYEEAKKYFNQSLKIDSLFKDSIIQIYSMLAKNALKISDLEKAVSLYQDLANLIPDYNQANNLFIVGDLNFEQGNYISALGAYRKALAIDSNSSTARASIKKLIKCFIECDSLESALNLAEQEYKRSKVAENILQLGEIKYRIGERLFNHGLLDSAGIVFSAVIALQEPKSLLDETYFYLGEIQYAQDSLSAALELYKKVLRLNPYQKGEIVKRAQERIKEIREKK